MRSCPRQLAARLPPPRLPTSALAGPALAVLKVMKDAGQSNTPKTARWGRLSGLVNVCFVPKADIPRCGRKLALFDHFVGAGKYCRRNDEAECFCSFRIDHQLVL